uniref:Uncharacterized protein n=1 Tax=Aegilops tauschii subsp. strangulata TaxID=200361 RepID=A0A453N170_AEGTS
MSCCFFQVSTDYLNLPTSAAFSGPQYVQYMHPQMIATHHGPAPYQSYSHLPCSRGNVAPVMSIQQVLSLRNVLDLVCQCRPAADAAVHVRSGVRAAPRRAGEPGRHEAPAVRADSAAAAADVAVPFLPVPAEASSRGRGRGVAERPAPGHAVVRLPAADAGAPCSPGDGAAADGAPLRAVPGRRRRRGQTTAAAQADLVVASERVMCRS